MRQSDLSNSPETLPQAQERLRLGKEHAGQKGVTFAPPSIHVEKTAEGGYLLRSTVPLGSYEKNLGTMLRQWGKKVPDRNFLAERTDDGGWRFLTYGDACRIADSIAQALIDRRLGPQRPVMILSGNSINHALLMLGGFIAGVPVAPVSVAYSLLSQDFSKVRYIFQTVRPALLFAEDGLPFARAVSALDLSDAEVVTGSRAIPGIRTTPFSTLCETAPTGEVEKAFSTIGPDSIAKYLFSSGSTGLPKGVINTHGMLCANQQMLSQVWPFVRDRPPILVDWLPWSHTFGGNHNFNLILSHGGTLYIDGGKPMAGMMETTVRNLAEISPTIYFNVPAGYAMALPYLERDESLRRNFFRNLQMIFYAGAALSQDLWHRLEKVAIQATGKKVVMTSSWGSTETSPLATAAHFPLENAGNIGVPCPGVTLKMVPNHGKYELRVKGPNVTSGYLHRPDLTENAFDEEGFYKIGDAGKFADPRDPSRGLVFDGRVAEDFKLNTGTWVHVGKLRLELLAEASAALHEVLVAGHDREYIGILAWPNLEGCRHLCRDFKQKRSPGDLIRSLEVKEYLRTSLGKFNSRQQGSATRVRRIRLMTEPPSIDDNEITDKGYINQRASLEKRKHLIKELFSATPGPETMIID